jgi:hypothetical protein
MGPRESAFVKRIANEIPGFSVERKGSSYVQQVIGFLVKPFCPDYATHFATTIYPKVYLPGNLLLPENGNAKFQVLAHEWVHLYDRRQEGFPFNFMYLFPQSLSPLFLMLAASTWKLPIAGWSLLALAVLALLPWPAPWRLKYELRGYVMGWALDAWESKSGPSTDIKEKIVKQLTGWAYYKTCWSKQEIVRRLDIAEKWASGQVRLGKFEGRPMYPYIVVKDFVDKFPRKQSHG